jgi:chromosome partitioning protein
MENTSTAAFLNQKGGVGKTTTVANVGAGLTILGSRVLLVDLDPQSHLTRFLGIDRQDVRASVYDVLRGEAEPADAIITRPLNARLHMDGQSAEMAMALMPSTQDLADADTALARATGREFLLRRALDKVAGDYDHILLDCPPSLGLVSTNALVASRTVFVPVQSEYLALDSLESLLARVESIRAHFNVALEIGGLIATRFDGRKVLNRSVVESLRERYGAMLLDTVVRENIVLAESPGQGKDIFSYRPRSFGAEDYLNLATEIMDRLTPVLEADPAEADLDLDALEWYAQGPQ